MLSACSCITIQPTELYTPSLHDALPICLLEQGPARIKAVRAKGGHGQTVVSDIAELEAALGGIYPSELLDHGLVLEENLRSEEHTSELQSTFNLVCLLLLELNKSSLLML